MSYVGNPKQSLFRKILSYQSLLRRSNYAPNYVTLFQFEIRILCVFALNSSPYKTSQCQCLAYRKENLLPTRSSKQQHFCIPSSEPAVKTRTQTHTHTTHKTNQETNDQRKTNKGLLCCVNNCQYATGMKRLDKKKVQVNFHRWRCYDRNLQGFPLPQKFANGVTDGVVINFVVI